MAVKAATGFRQLDISLALSVKPYYLRNLDEGVDAEMQKHLLKFVPEFDGVLIAWWDIRFSDRSGALLWEFPEVHIQIALRVLVFSPQRGMAISGTINGIAHDHLSLSVCESWKAQIHIADFPTGITLENYAEDESVQFYVKKVQIDDDILSITGSFREPETSTIITEMAVDAAASADVDEKQKRKKSSKKRARVSEKVSDKNSGKKRRKA